MFDIINHLCVFSLITVFYYSSWVFSEKFRSEYEWYIPGLAAAVVFFLCEAVAWPVWYLFFS